MSLSKISALSQIVYQAARKGDKIAIDIFRQAGKHLALGVIASVNRLKMSRISGIKVSYIGSVWKSGGLLLNPFKRTIRKAFPMVNFVPPVFPPVIGAYLIALRKCDIKPDKDTFNNLSQSLRKYAWNL
ncbi:MAG: BadF/BadG/BcrA/BcrD ATPase family protein [Planctomycetota bacterium]